MESVSKTLYIPLYAKAFVSRRGLVLEDRKAEEIWDAEGFPLRGKAKSKWLAYTMGMRSAVFDRWLEQTMAQLPDAAILHLGCGLDSRILRVGQQGHPWYDVDFPDVIARRKRYFEETPEYHMISADIREKSWLSQVPAGHGAIILMEGISMYLPPEALKAALRQWKDRFGEIRILMDCYTVLGARASKYRNPINQVGITQVYGFDDPRDPLEGTGILFVREHTLTPQQFIAQLPKAEQRLFRTIFAGSIQKKLCRLYEYR